MEFGGPDALTRAEAVRLFEEVTGSAFSVRRAPSAALRAGMRVLRRPRPRPASVMGLAYCADHEPATWDAAPLEALGIRPRGTRAYAEAVVRAAAT